LAPWKLIEASIIFQEIKKIEKDYRKPTTNQIENLKKK
jgi:hypothetical protein